MDDLQGIHEFIDYNPETGELTCIKQRRGSRVKPGEVFTGTDSHGYIQVRYGKMYKGHQLAFYFETGSIPALIDHIDRVRTNNKWTNLREATPLENSHNKTNNNKTVGVHYHTVKQIWRAQVTFENRRIVKDCPTEELAIAKVAELRRLIEIASKPLRLKTTQIQTTREQIKATQDYKCALCKVDFREAKLVGKRLVPKYIACLDHDHLTGRVRGVLCNMCNQTDGKIKNRVNRAKKNLTQEEWLGNLLDYWQRPPSNLIHPAHKSDDQKRELRNKRARQKTAAAKAAKILAGK